MCAEVKGQFWFSSSTIWVLGIELMSSGLVAGVFFYQATSLAPSNMFKEHTLFFYILQCWWILRIQKMKTIPILVGLII